MKADERRLSELIENPNGDDVLEQDIPLIRAGLLLLNWTDRPAGRVHPFVTANPIAADYLDKCGRLTPTHRRKLRELATVSRADIEFAKENIQPKY